MLTYMGLKIIENPMLTKTTEDWSRVRSHGRARRRRWKHRQNINILTVPSDLMYLTGDAVICHPAKVRELRKAMEDNQSSLPDPAKYKPSETSRAFPMEDMLMRYWLLRKTTIFRTDVI